MNWTTETSADSAATAEQVWAAYADVANWPKWDVGIVSCRIDGDFVRGTTGALRPVGAPEFWYELTDVQVNRGFSDQTPMPHRLLPLARLHLSHELTPLASGGTRITHRVRFSGLLGWLAARLMRAGFEKDMPHAVQTLATYAQSMLPEPVTRELTHA